MSDEGAKSLCFECKRPLVEIDNRGQRFRGCMTCNIWWSLIDIEFVCAKMLPFNIFANRATPAAAIIIPISIAISIFHMYAVRYIDIQVLLYSYSFRG